MKHLLSVLAAVLMISVPRASAQSTQLDVLWHSVIGTRVVDVVNQWQTTPLRGAYLLTMTDVQTGAASEVPLPHARGAVSRI